MKYSCKVCGYIYDEAEQKKPFADLPTGWKCPLCGAPKAMFAPVAPAGTPAAVSTPVVKIETDMRELSAAEVSVIFSNLARGCEKQYQPEAQRLYGELSRYFADRAPEPETASLDALAALIQKNLETDYPAVRETAVAAKDRGTQRICAWGEKVTAMLSALLAQYASEGDAMLENTEVWVCTVCGFVYIGKEPPRACPVCKVPDWKFEKMKGRG